MKSYKRENGHGPNITIRYMEDGEEKNDASWQSILLTKIKPIFLSSLLIFPN